LYPLVFFPLKKRNEKIKKITETQERQETHTRWSGVPSPLTLFFGSG